MMSRSAKSRRARVLRCFEALESRRLLAGDMTNPNNPLDVNNDATVSASDALAIINYLGRAEGEAAIAINGNGDPIFPDTSGNGTVAASDALRVINALAEGEEVEPPAPDLEVVSVSVNDAGTVGSAVLRNNGVTTDPISTSVSVEVEIDGEFDELGTVPVSFAAGEATTTGSVAFADLVDFDIPAGTYNIRLEIDPEDLIDETSEENRLETAITLSEIDGDGSDDDNMDDIDDDDNGSTGGGDSVDTLPMSVKVRTGKNPKLEFSGSNQNIVVTSPAARQLRFQGAELDRTISIKYDLHIKLHGTGNRISFDGANIPDDLFVHVYGADNTVHLSGANIGDDFIYHGNKRAETLIIEGQTAIRDDLIIHTKDGHDTVLVNNASVGDDFILHTKDGNDVLAVNGLNVGDDMIVRLGDDQDTLSLANVAVRDRADAEGDRGIDSFAADVNSVRAKKADFDEFETEGALANVPALIDAALGSMAELT